MPFQPWQPPRAAALELRTITRHIGGLAHPFDFQRLNRLTEGAPPFAVSKGWDVSTVCANVFADITRNA